MLGDDAVN